MNNILCLWSQEFKVIKSKLNRIIVVGCGKFGKRAVEKLSRKYGDSRIVVVDSDSIELERVSRQFPDVDTVSMDGLEYLVNVASFDSELWIVPAIPVHVAAEWLTLMAKADGFAMFSRMVVPEEFIKRVPNPIKGENGDLYCSFATFVCPDNCPEPENICTYTKEPRKGNLFEVIAKAVPDGYKGIVFRSFQLAPGVGGYPAESFLKALDFTRKTNTGTQFIVATACRCHGVATSLLVQ